MAMKGVGMRAVSEWDIEYLPSKRGFDSLRGNMQAMGAVRYGIEPLGVSFALPDGNNGFIPHEVLLAYAMAGMAAPSVLGRVATGWIGQAGRMVVEYPSAVRRAVAVAVCEQGMEWVMGMSEDDVAGAVAGGIALVGGVNGYAVDLSGLVASPHHRAVAWARGRARRKHRA
jgi:hypothetical protein